MNQKEIAIILITTAVLIVLGVAGHYIVTGNPTVPIDTPEQQSSNEVPQDQEGLILSLSIEPSMKVRGWIIYHAGAKAVLKGRNLSSVEARYFSTGTGITESSLAGKMNKVIESPDGDTWEVKLPPQILAADFWAEAEDLAGRKIKSAYLGSVGYEESKQGVNSVDVDVTAVKICGQEPKSSMINRCGAYYAVYPGGFILDAGTKIYDSVGTYLNTFCGGYQVYTSDSERLKQERICADYLKNCRVVVESC